MRRMTAATCVLVLALAVALPGVKAARQGQEQPGDAVSGGPAISPDALVAIQQRIAAALLASKSGDWKSVDEYYLMASRQAELAGDPKVLKEVLAMRLGALLVNGSAVESLKVSSKLVGLCKPGAGLPDTDLGTALYLRAGALRRAGQFREALPVLERAIEVLTRALGRDNTMVFTARLERVQNLETMGRFQDSLDDGKSLLEDVSKVGVADQFLSAIIKGVIAAAQIGLGDIEKARASLEQLKEFLRTKRGGPGVGPWSARVLASELYMHLDELNESGRLALQALKDVEVPGREDTLAVVPPLSILGNVYARLGKIDQAEKAMKRLGPLMKRLNAAKHPMMGISLETAAYIRKAKGDSEGARRWAGRAKAIVTEAVGSDHWMTKGLVQRLETIK